MTLADRIEKLVAPAIAMLGYDLVRATVSGDQHKTLQIMAERQDGAAMTVDDCGQISRQVSAVLDVEDPIKGSYDLEVSSPGIDRPLVREMDFERYAGYEARIEMVRAVDGRRKFKGKLLGIEESKVKILVGDTAIELPFAEIERAKLILTDELLGSAKQQYQS